MKASKEYILELTNNLLSYVKPRIAFNEDRYYLFEFVREIGGKEYIYSVAIKDNNEIVVKLYCNSKYCHNQWLGSLFASIDRAEYHKLMLKAYTVYDLYVEQLLKEIAVCPDGKDAFDKLVE